MKSLYKWWIALESCKLFIILMSWVVLESSTMTSFLLILLVVLTILNYWKTWIEFKDLTNKLFTEDNLEIRGLLNKLRTILMFIMFFDLLPFMPLIQGILRYSYYLLSKKRGQIINTYISPYKKCI